MRTHPILLLAVGLTLVACDYPASPDGPYGVIGVHVEAAGAPPSSASPAS